MDKEKKHKIASILGGAFFIIGLLLCALRGSEITAHKIVSAKITSVEEYSGECRRVSGKYGECIHAKLGVEFPVNKAGELKSGSVDVERTGAALTVGASIKVMFKTGKPETVKIADLSSGWKGPLGVLFVGALILIVSRSAPRRS
jgi:hypothetical protein